MSLTVSNSTEYKINELAIVAKNGKIDISKFFIELSIFDSMFLPVMSGNILIKDSVGMSSKLLFDGSEVILIDIQKDEQGIIGNLKKAFRVYKQTDRSADGESSETYILNFVSQELLFSDQQRVNQSYRKTYTEMAERIMLDYLLIPQNNLGGIYEPSSGVRQSIIPNLRPIEAIEWVMRKSVNNKNSPSYVFFQNLIGYNFASLSSFLNKGIVLDIKFETKNKNEKGAAFDELSTARSFEVISEYDNIKKTRSGVNAGTFIGFDLVTRNISRRALSFSDHYDNLDHANKTPNFTASKNQDGLLNSAAYDSRIVLDTFSTTRVLSNYVREHDPESIAYNSRTEDYAFQRKAIFENLNSKKIKLVMPGNFTLSSGFNVNVNAPTFGEKGQGSENKNPLLSGKYLITASRHIITPDKHDSIIECSSTSSDLDFVQQDTNEQNESLKAY
tara:strand:+ start:1100 stop:2437 length:1338 start_codon:yes stop_codon:yes gene_type:complete